MIYALLALYFFSGLGIWLLGLKAEGGSKGYMNELREEFNHPRLLFVTAEIAVILFWPFFIIRGIVQNEDKSE